MEQENWVGENNNSTHGKARESGDYNSRKTNIHNTRFFLVKTVRFLNTNSNETCDKKAWLSISTLNFKEALEGPSLQIPTRAVNIESPGSVRLWEMEKQGPMVTQQ